MDEFGSVKVVEVKKEAEPVQESIPGDSYAVTGSAQEIKTEDGERKAFTGTVVQITNVSPQATIQQMATLFGFLGTIVDIRIYPTEETKQVAVKLCYVKFDSPEIGGVAQHLTNTVFIDKALIVVPLNINEIPEESDCCQLLTSINAFAGLSTTFMSNPENKTPISFPTPPMIVSSLDPAELDDIKRTVFIDCIDEEVTSSQLLAFFSGVGEIKYLRLCKHAEKGKYAFVEFSQIESVMAAMQYNGVLFGGRPLKVDYAKSGIKKPESTLIALGRGGGTQRGPVVTPTARTKSRSKSKERDRSSSRRRKSRSRSRDRSARRRRSRSRSKRRSRSRDRSNRRKKSRSRSRSKSRKRRRSRSKSKDKDRKRSKSRSRSPRKKKRSRSRSPRKKRSRSRSSDRKKKDKKDKDKDKEREKEKDKDKDKKKKKKDEDEKSSKDKPKVKKEDEKSSKDKPKVKKESGTDSDSD